MIKTTVTLPQKIKTARLFLRPYQAGDGVILYAAGIRNRAHLGRFESGNFLLHLKDEAEAEVIARELGEDWANKTCFFTGIFEAKSHEWVGQVYIGPTNWEIPAFAIGYIADLNYEGKGYISEAVRALLEMLFVNLKAQRVSADCHEDNERSWRLLERCGFKREGHLRNNKLNPDSSLHGDYLYGLLRDEFMG